MHDQKKEYESQLSEATKQRREALIAEFRAAYDEVFALRDKNDLSAEALKRVDVLLTINPELYTIFNYRRRILQRLWTPSQEMEAAVAGENRRNMVVSELKWNGDILKADYKVYSAWLHRRWLLGQLDQGTLAAALAKERKQCEAILTLDKRNFHAWGYRRWVMSQQNALDGIDADKRVTDFEAVLELDAQEDAFTQAKIQDNFSNYSAWHSRIALFENFATAYLNAVARGPDASDASMAILDRILMMIEGDVQLAIKAFFCDAEDQSTWFYMHTLLSAMRTLTEKVNSAVSEPDDQLEFLMQAYAFSLMQISDCCVTLIRDATSSSSEPASAEALSLFPDHVEALKTTLVGIKEGLTGVKWPSWTLLKIVQEHPFVIPEPRDVRTLLATLYVVDPQRRGYYQDIAASL